MTNFPTLPAPAFPIPVETEDPALRSDFENGSQQTRAKFTRQRRTWTLTWPALTTTQRNALSAFWIFCRGGAEEFMWTEPETNTSIAVRFLVFKETQKTPDLWDETVQIKEV